MREIGRLVTLWTVAGMMAGVTGIMFYFSQVWLIRSLVAYIKEVEKNRDEWRDAWLEKRRL